MADRLALRVMESESQSAAALTEQRLEELRRFVDESVAGASAKASAGVGVPREHVGHQAPVGVWLWP